MRGACKRTEFANTPFAEIKTNKERQKEMKDKVIIAKHNNLRRSNLSLGLAVALALGVWLPGGARAADEMKGGPDMLHMQHIMTQTQAEALKPGDAMAMVCSKCKVVIVQKVTADNAHVKMMTVGEKVKCHPGCDGTLEVVATGKGEGKDAEVKHVCSKCGDDAMFCSAVKPGTGSFYEKRDEILGR